MFKKGGEERLNINGQLPLLYRFMEWIMRLAYLQLLWIACMCLGLVAGGFFPSTTAMFSVARKWIRKDTDIEMGPLFWNQFKTDFVKANAAGYLMLAAGFVLYFYFRFFQGNGGMVSLLFVVIFLFLLFVYCMTFIFLFPIYVHYRLSVFQLIRYSFLFSLGHPFHVITMSVCVVLFILIVSAIPGLIPFFSFSLLAFALMWIANLAFKKADHTIGQNG
jgi:uncharacterized membrane protein YesL